MGAPVKEHKPTNIPAITGTNQDSIPNDLGYYTKAFIATVALLIGDAVYISATAGNVTKSTTDADYLTFAGIVVGGPSYSPVGDVCFDSARVGDAAAAIGETVIVACEGSIVYGRTGAAGVTAGKRLAADATTAGRVRIVPAASTKTTFATALEAQAAAASPVKMYIHYNQQTVVA